MYFISAVCLCAARFAASVERHGCRGCKVCLHGPSFSVASGVRACVLSYDWGCLRSVESSCSAGFGRD